MSIDDCRTRHHKAMELIDEATRARHEGNQERAQSQLREAFALEKEAAALVASDLDLEPTRSVLHRSAASLALQLGEAREAERLIATALAGSPPEEIAEELRDLLEQIYAKRVRKAPRVEALT
jgi:hypothetical protein